jgi:hypothetical protein
MGVWQGVAMDSLKFIPARHARPSTSCGWATPDTALRPIHEWDAHRAGSIWPLWTPLDTPRYITMIQYAHRDLLPRDWKHSPSSFVFVALILCKFNSRLKPHLQQNKKRRNLHLQIYFSASSAPCIHLSRCHPGINEIFMEYSRRDEELKTFQERRPSNLL